MKAVYGIIFIVLTVLCWCPIGYGSYGEVSMIMGMPSWAFTLLVIGAILFIVEWYYLFISEYALYDRDLDDILSALTKTNKEIEGEN